MAQEEIGSLVVNIEANMRNLQDNLNNVTERVGGFGSKIGKLGGLIAGALAGGALVDFLKQSVTEAAEAESAMNALNSVITSTAGKAGITADAAEGLADGLEKVTNFSKESILGGESLLLTFTSIGKEVFPQATETALNMSQALGQDMKSSSIQLGKALNDPINGMSALSRVGVSFTEEQKNTIKTLQESGDIMGAQKVILAELSTEFGGAAKAAGETFAGKMKQLDDKLGEVRETIGNALMPALLSASDWFVAKLPIVEDFIKKGMNELAYAIQFVSDNAEILIPIITGLTAAISAQAIIGTITNLYNAWKAATVAQTTATWLLNTALRANPFGLVVTAIGLLVAAGVALYRNWDMVKTKASELWVSVKNTFASGINAAIEQINKLIDIMNKIPGVKVPLISRVRLDTSQNTTAEGFRAVRGFATGTNFVPNDMLAQIHKGEAVIPAKNNPSNPNASNPIGQSINYDGMFNGATFNVRSDNDAKMIAREIFNLQQSRSRGSGVIAAT